MEQWTAPPGFGRAGAPPPIRSVETVTPRQFALVRFHRVGRGKGLRACKWLIGEDDSIDVNRPELEPFRRWLKENEDALALHVRQARIENVDYYLTEAASSQFWERESQIRQIPPGGKATVTRKVTVGMSRTDTEELSSKIGVDGKAANLPGLTSELATKFSQSVTLSEQREDTEQLELANETPDRYKVFAVWRYIQSVTFRVLDIEADFFSQNLVLRSVGPLHLNTGGGATVVSADVPLQPPEPSRT